MDINSKDIHHLIAKEISDPHTFYSYKMLNKKIKMVCDPLTNEKNMEFSKIRIVGLRIEHYIGKAVVQNRYNFEYHDAEFKRHVLCCRYHGDGIEITLRRSEGECYSGYTTASFGHIKVKQVSRFGSYGYVPKEEMFLEYPFKNIMEYESIHYKNNVFEYSNDGGDKWYPQGSYSVNMDLFKKTIRAKDKRMIWIFQGDSGSGKSYLSTHLSGNGGNDGNDINDDNDEPFTSFETDSYNILPDNIPLKCNIIVLGNKYNHTKGDIISRIQGEYELLIVSFTTTCIL
jgi:hypothetical protein